MKIHLLLVALCLYGQAVVAQQADDIIGVWFNDDKSAKIEISKASDKYQGKIIWLKEPNRVSDGKPKTDENNPDENQRNSPIIGLKILKDFEFEDGEWEDGTIYDPENGETYDCVITMDGNILNVRGYIGFSFIGRTTEWTKAN